MPEESIEVTVEDLAAARDAGAEVLDVRSPEEYARGHVPGARNIPLEQVLRAPGEFPDGVRVVCQSGGRSLRAAQALREAGVDAVSVSGGTAAWVESGRNTEGGAQR
ncbi:rhodanese-like domain-containing protein [Actinopolyspora erythraea]|uniref:Rhodanese-like domain-containing protein n=1 Tax=Actinopolyspora erythraea TaxID=414996 RepID=A0A099D2N6_9ACTN|nr:rhodanese-like domain-containing protein [Actinopolyspora erythraea]ASU80795.1 rhodanese-like domain-containing protein [Actinopolyspora erythraea]KGI80334.1 sulfurtransferase [Actinopolyspora erythraea]